jgi:hypothetical protein
MRSVINTNINVTTLRNEVRTIVAGVENLRAASLSLRLYAAPAPRHWDHDDGDQPFAGKQKPAFMGPMPAGSDLTSRSCRESSRCRRPRVSNCLARS